MTLLHVTASKHLWRLSAGALLLGALGNPLFAQCVAANGDSSFAQDTGTNTPQFPGDRNFFFRIGRVVGPGVASEYVSQGDPDPIKRGTLVNWKALQDNGVVSQKAYLEISGRILLEAPFWSAITASGNLDREDAAAAVKFTYSINGVPLPGYYMASAVISNPTVSVSSIPFVRCVEVDTKYLRFARKLSVEGGACSTARATDKTCPGVNQVSVRILATWWGKASVLANAGSSPFGVFSVPLLGFLAGQATNAINAINAIASVGTLSFKALHPVIMIHGNSSSERFWTNQVEPACPRPPCDPHWNFEQPFIDQRVPYFRQINMANQLAELHVPILQRSIVEVKEMFGTSQVHLVGHSKGGIDTRLWIASEWFKPAFPAISVTTVATPHHGSAHADYGVSFARANALASDNSVRVWAAEAATTNDGHLSLTTDFGRRLQTENLPQLRRTVTLNGQVRAVKYHSIVADANLNDSVAAGLPTIQFAEVIGANNLGDRRAFLSDSQWVAIVQSAYVLLWEVREAVLELRNSLILGTRVLAIREIRGGPFQNDFLVTLPSGRVPELYQEIASVKANHTSIANPVTGLAVLNAIRLADSVR